MPTTFSAASTVTARAAYHDIRRTEIFERYHFDIAYDAHRPDEHAPGRHPLALFRDGELIGTVRIDVLDRARVSLRLIAIRGVRQGDGHGRTLLALAENRVREPGRGEVVMHGNDDALGFYRSLGYSETEWDEEPTAPGSTKIGKRL